MERWQQLEEVEAAEDLFLQVALPGVMLFPFVLLDLYWWAWAYL